MLYISEILILIHFLTSSHMIEFKSKKIEEEYRKAPLALKMLASEVDDLMVRSFGQNLFITRILGKVGIKESGVHQEYLAFDARDQYWDNGWKRLFSNEEAAMIEDHFNRRYFRIDKYKTCIHHGGTALHFHFQLPHLMVDLRDQDYQQ